MVDRNNQQQPLSQSQQQWWFTNFVQLMSLLSGMLTILVGIVHTARRVDPWCFDAVTDESFSCIGPSIFWSEDKFLEISNGPTTWGSVFSLDPNIFMDNFAPVLVGFITLSVHMPGDESWNPIGRSWTRYFGWFLFVSFFANAGYAGNFGLVVALLNIFMAITCLIVRFSTEERRPTDLDVIKEAARTCRCFDAKLTVLVSTGRMLTMVATFITLAVGLIHVFSQFGTWCDKDAPAENTACVGPLLVWWAKTSDAEAVDDRNDEWRGVVGLTPAALANNFAPLIFGVLMTLAHRKGSVFQPILRSWYRVSALCLIVALFAGFGFAGNLGVIAGFILSATSIVHLFVALLDADVQRPFLEIQFHFLASADNTTDPEHDSNDLEANRNNSRPNGRDDIPGIQPNRNSLVTSSDDESQSGDEVGPDGIIIHREERRRKHKKSSRSRSHGSRGHRSDSRGRYGVDESHSRSGSNHSRPSSPGHVDYH